jgi:hypothetical protein
MVTSKTIAGLIAGVAIVLLAIGAFLSFKAYASRYLSPRKLWVKTNGARTGPI